MATRKAPPKTAKRKAKKVLADKKTLRDLTPQETDSGDVRGGRLRGQTP